MSANGALPEPVGDISHPRCRFGVEIPGECRESGRHARYDLVMNSLLISLIVLVSGFAVVLTGLRVQAEDTCSAAHRIYHSGTCAVRVDELR